MEVLMTSHAPSYPYSPTSQRPLRHRIEKPLKKGTSHLFFFSKRSSVSGHRRLVLVAGAKKGNSEKKKKADSHVFVPRPDEATGPFPEAVLLKQKKVQEDGRELPEFLDPEEEKLFEFLSLQLESDLNVERKRPLSVEWLVKLGIILINARHYEVVYLIHEDKVDEVESVITKVQDFIREKKGKIWRLNNWGMRRLAYKIKKAKNANYVLMNFELGAQWTDEFKNMLDKDERIIRHLVIKRDEAITEDCPPPLEFHTLRAGGLEDDDEDMEGDNDGEDWEDEEEMDELSNYEDGNVGSGIIYVDDDDEGVGDLNTGNVGVKTLKAKKLSR
ncbi:hypothetical protein QJS04_geneDACA015877 [Acorus gramineus]|uniref:Ribosomal protein S6 n=1 Tax=Acorus gramineus TaxID=55184 RepID=A0AAV9BJN5_ACOGR|nr:hypothetical protein QJS04_geneDACA015877 [Acorus gramineus]